MEPWTIKDIVSLIAIVNGPIAAVAITLWINKRRETRKGKHELFLTLIAKRKTFPITHEFVDALNCIDVVFYSHKEVLTAWNSYYDSLNRLGDTLDVRDNRLLDLLDAMAKVLGYDRIRQTTLARFYTPQQFANQADFAEMYNAELMRLVQSSSSLGTLAQASTTSVPNAPMNTGGNAAH